MSRIRYKWTSPEKKVHNFLKGNKIQHKMHPKPAPGADILIPGRKMAVLLHGCFWHACPKCGRIPKSRVSFWSAKIAGNRKRDNRIRRLLWKKGFAVLRIWEHELAKKNQARLVRRIQRVMCG